ncbi:MAG: hypothetical protein BWY84_00058 [Candidatus Aerophobetes bacterium ADurb.Bin490]|nr:MAG: hypothetical protein BWY84_00058 [Candidatus Aerophobetes bacterium ADurb.Bin490]
MKGGYRTGAGRKKKDRSNQDYFEDAESYLLAVVQGRAIPDAVRVQAAKSLIAYQTAKKRAPVKSPAPAKLQEKMERDIEKSNAAEFEAKAAEILKKHRRIKS